MDLSLSDAETSLADSVRLFVTRSLSTRTLVELRHTGRDFEPEWTAKMADAGWLGALVPPECGGGGANCLEASIIWEQLGSAPLPGPFFVSSVVSVLLLRHAEPSPLRDELLSAIATGGATVVPILNPAGGDWRACEPPYVMRPEGDEITATIPYVAHARTASHFLVPFPSESGGVDFTVVPAKNSGVGIRPLAGFLAAHDELTFTGVSPDGESVRCRAEDLGDAFAWCYVLMAAFVVGGCQALLKMSVDYSNSRVQFGQPVGKFQRVQDHIVELVNALDAARWAAYDAIWRIDSGHDGRGAAHMARAVAGDAYITCADAAHKVHGGIGVDPDYGLTLYTQMSRTLYHFLGSPRWHRRAMVAARGWLA
jgi:alkylation response protein AidB-like acyl-CoA dehydrogenase